MSGRSILFALTSYSPIAASYSSGLWFEELAIPYRMFAAAGHTLRIASAKGGLAPVDPHSMPPSDALEPWRDILEQLQDTPALAEFSADEIDAIFIPGGPGALFDLPHCIALHQLLTPLDQQRKPIAAVSQGTAGLIGATGATGGPLLAGRRITTFTDEQHRAMGLEPLLPYRLEQELRARGAEVLAGPSWAVHIEQDGTLITGQNPRSCDAVAEALIAALSVGSG